ncbi:urate hydroxylase PuuD [Tritonibacter mobilis]|uniref:urate hydroxylase PuuD n=1 Tax=Tritonibacter mobilis TaxID=379347 RepID=UPI001447AEBF|nr:urate hydroxylase PuuD [Tritonibacter mobilis]MCA2008384.1 urate hydroxylase PuuD [Tritonibacter mobilis]NKX39476.1 urate hydroxylase PuuD [Rhodobacteraceae bacterium R_SAG5]
MQELVIMWDWLAFAVRWLHVITAIAWIGSSFYFVALDLGLRKVPHLPVGAHGEEWQVHGGGFYHIQKYLVAPANMPDHLIWFKWESYATWLSGAGLLMIVYWAGGELYLIDAGKADLALWQGILISGASLSVGWLVYDFLCKSPLGEKPTLLMVLLFVLLVAMGYGYNQIFTGRAVMLHLGAFTATIMTANVFFIIMPNQRIVVKDLQEGRTPDAKYGKIAKLRSTHNNYLTLPVIFLMLSNHYPLAFATEYNWLIAALVFLMGVTIRHYFNTCHAGTGNPTWTWPVTILLFIAIMALSQAPLVQDTYEDSEARELTQTELAFAGSEHFEDVMNTVPGRCAMCHSREPYYDGIRRAPKNVLLETPADVAKHARQIYLQAGATHAMPPANVTYMEDEERALIRKWYADGAKDLPFYMAGN